MNDWRIAEVVLIAVLAGALLPAILQLFLTLRAAQRTLETLRPQVEATLAGIGEIVVRVDKLSATLEADTRLPAFLSSVEDLAKGLEDAKKAVAVVTNVGSVLMPAIAAGFRAMRGSEGEGEPEHPNANGAEPQASPSPPPAGRASSAAAPEQPHGAMP